jgi:hypothetical protein
MITEVPTTAGRWGQPPVQAKGSESDPAAVKYGSGRSNGGQ